MSFVSTKISTATLKDVAADLHDLGFKASYFKNVRAAVNKAPRLYNAPMQMIPACPTAFDNRWTDETGYCRLGFNSQKAWTAWRTDMRAALTRYQAGGAPLQKAPDTWTPILGFCKDAGVALQVCHCNAHFSLRAVAREARSDGLSPHELSDIWATTVRNRLNSAMRDSFRRGLGQLNKLIASPIAHAELPGLLPTDAVAVPATVPSKKTTYAGALPAALPTSLHEDFKRFVDFKRHGAMSLRLAEEDDTTTFSDKTVSSYGYAVGWLWRMLVKAEIGEPATFVDLSSLCTLSNIHRAAQVFIEMRRDTNNGLDPEASTLSTYISRCSHIAVEYCSISAKDAATLKAFRSHDLVCTASTGQMSARRLAWMREFAENTAEQRRVLDLPSAMMTESRKILDDWDALKHQNARGKMMQGLRIGIAAAQTAILLYGSPVRARNLRELTIIGGEASLILPHRKGDALRIAIPAKFVKNNRPIDGEIDSEALPVLRFYLDEIRPRLITDHPFNKNYCDSAFLFPSTRIESPMETSAFAAAFALGTGHSGIDMVMHMMRHVTAFFILDEDPNAWVEAAELLGHSELTLRKYYAFISQRKSQTSARALMRKQRKARGLK